MIPIAYKHQQLNKQVQLISHKDIDAILAARHGERYTAYRRDWRESMLLERVPDFPLSLEIETNNFCNFSCNMCVFAGRGLHPDARRGIGKRHMDMAVFQAAVEEGARHGLPAMTYGFMSEPLLHPRVADMVAFASERGVLDQRLGTNGQLLTRETSRALIDAGLSRLEVSLDATNADTYAKIRRGGNFERIMRNVHDFLDEREKTGGPAPLLRVSFLRLNVNRDELEEFLDYWQRFADFFSIQEPVDYDLDMADSPLEFDPARDKEDFRCDKQFQRLFIRNDGSVLACGHIHGWDEFKLGMVGERPLLEMWRSPFMESMRDMHRRAAYRENAICRYCVRQTATAEQDAAELGEVGAQ